MPNVTYMRLCDASVICRVTYFQFPIQSVFLPYRSTGKTAAYVLYRISDIGRCRKLGKYVSCTERTVQRNDFELILTVTMETRHPVENYFDSEFRAICNQCGVMAAWSRKTLKFEDDFFAFWGKKTPCGKISKILFRKFSLLHQSTFFFKFREICQTENRRNRTFFTSKKLAASQTVATARIAPKIGQGQPQTMYSECSRFYPNRFTFNWVIAERVNIAKLPRRVNPLFGGSLASSQITS